MCWIRAAQYHKKIQNILNLVQFQPRFGANSLFFEELLWQNQVKTNLRLRQDTADKQGKHLNVVIDLKFFAVEIIQEVFFHSVFDRNMAFLCKIAFIFSYKVLILEEIKFNIFCCYNVLFTTIFPEIFIIHPCCIFQKRLLNIQCLI